MPGNVILMKHLEKETSAELTESEKETIEALLNYPTLEKIFDQNESNSYSNIRQNMQSVLVELERIIRRGSREDAIRATKIVGAYQTTINFLDELEQRRQNQSK